MYKCEVCSRQADIHHIVHKNEGGLDFPLNYKYLCPEHHRGKQGPHRNSKIDIEYKLEMQEKLRNILNKNFYTMEELIIILELNKTRAKKFFKDLKLFKEGYKKEDIIYRLMGRKIYDEQMLEDYYEIMVVLI
ncbi:HNH endonuclease [Clostridium sp. YIM B02515]|uniref:HNH endonuclease n=1 Tax=Clostridium rhizosphaerae TaxID=2803861 RepID=A0ABS1T7T4_9CLOT|nr:HNH endonuclease signature motif containing protein [Clostridium rhizosphaerae]MBL4935390.1 HNH endonuclease [Clostridium rhizosphaerae]